MTSSPRENDKTKNEKHVNTRDLHRLFQVVNKILEFSRKIFFTQC